MTMKTDKLHRSPANSMICGVAGGMAEYFDIDPTLMRIAWVLIIAISAGTALLAYIILAIIMPKEVSNSTDEADVRVDDSDGSAPAGRIGGRWTGRRSLLGLVLIGVGAVFLLNNLGVFDWWRWDIFWPLVIIGVGVALFVGRWAGRHND